MSAEQGRSDSCSPQSTPQRIAEPGNGGDDNERSLCDALLATTRSCQARLDESIVDRIPLALSPRTSNPAFYTCGLLHIAAIYINFEALWNDMVKEDHPVQDTSLSTVAPSILGSVQLASLQLDANGIPLGSTQGNSQVHPPVASPRTRLLLVHLHLPGLMRSDSLVADLHSLTGWTENLVREQIREVATRPGALADFIAHTNRVVRHHPHVLVAYGYIFFMTLFTSGRFVRASLEAVGSDFWVQATVFLVPPSMIPTCRFGLEDELTEKDNEDETTNVGSPSGRHHSTQGRSAHALPLRFLHFTTVADGEDLRRNFMRRLAWAESNSLVTADERREIVCEAARIPDYLLGLVAQLDDAVTPSITNGRVVADPADLPFSTRLRDSVAVARERGLKAAAAFVRRCSFSAPRLASGETDEDEEAAAEVDGDDVDVFPSSESSQCSSSTRSLSPAPDAVVAAAPALPREKRYGISSISLMTGGLAVLVLVLAVAVARSQLRGPSMSLPT